MPCTLSSILACDPFVLGPELAIESINGLSCLRMKLGKESRHQLGLLCRTDGGSYFSSSNLSP